MVFEKIMKEKLSIFLTDKFMVHNFVKFFLAGKKIKLFKNSFLSHWNRIVANYYNCVFMCFSSEVHSFGDKIKSTKKYRFFHSSTSEPIPSKGSGVVVFAFIRLPMKHVPTVSEFQNYSQFISKNRSEWGSWPVGDILVKFWPATGIRKNVNFKFTYTLHPFLLL